MQAIVKNTIPLHMQIVEKRMRKDMMQIMAESLDEIRYNAFKKYMIPNRQGRERRSGKLKKAQPTHPTKLTSRTRALEKMLTEKAAWRIAFKRGVSRTGALVSTVRVLDTPTGVAIDSRISSRITDTSKYTGMVPNQKMTRQKLAARFFHDRPSGVRGTRRPNISLSGRDEVRIIERKILNKIRTWV